MFLAFALILGTFGLASFMAADGKRLALVLLDRTLRWIDGR